MAWNKIYHLPILPRSQLGRLVRFWESLHQRRDRGE